LRKKVMKYKIAEKGLAHNKREVEDAKLACDFVARAQETSLRSLADIQKELDFITGEERDDEEQ